MADNGKGNGEGQILQDEEQELDLDQIPTRPQKGFPYKRSGPGYQYWKQVEPKLDNWWFEFTTVRSKKGGAKFKLVSEFARSKARNVKERDWLQQMIGHTPRLLEGEKELLYEVPWMGDWVQERRLAQKILDKNHLRFLERQYNQQVDQLRKAEAVAYVAIRDIAKWTELQSQIDQAFGGQVFLDEDPTSTRNRKRVALYMTWQKRIQEQKHRAAVLYFQSLGLSAKENWTFINANMQQVNGKTSGHAQLTDGQPQDPQLQSQVEKALTEGQVTLDDLLMGKMIRYKAQQYKQRLPQDLEAMVEETTAQDLEKAQQKKKVH